MKSQALPPDQDRLIAMLRALGNPARYRILECLVSCPDCIVADIVQQTPLAQSTISQHLKVLRQAGLIRGEIEGAAINYCLDPAALRWLADKLQKLAARAQDEGCCPPGSGQHFPPPIVSEPDTDHVIPHSDCRPKNQ